MTVVRSVDHRTTAIGRQRQLLLVDGAAHVVPNLIAQILDVCRTPRPIDAQIDAVTRRLATASPAEVTARLDEMRRARLVLASDEYIRSAAGTTRSMAPLGAMGILTKDRPASMLAAVRSFAANAVRHERPARITVYDDSSPSAATNRSLSGLGRLQASFREAIEIRYAGIGERRAYAAELARLARVPQALADFAVLGLPDDGCTIGANRNSMLLDHVGQRFVSVDDDDLCVMVEHPERTGQVILCAERDPQDYWFFPSRRDALRRRRVDADFLGAHEPFLGRRLEEVLPDGPEGVASKAVCEHLMQAMRVGGASIAMTSTGIVGDSGMPYSGGYLAALPPESRGRLVADPLAYRSALESRDVLRVAQGTTVYHGGMCLGNVMGLDAGASLPPFSPLHRNEDGVFGLLLSLALPDQFIVHLPIAVLHNARRRPYPEDVAAGSGARTYSEIVMALAMARVPSASLTEPARRLAWVGNQLRAVASLPLPAFRETLRWELATRVGQAVAQIEDELRRWRYLPAYWAADLERVADSLSASLEHPDLGLVAESAGFGACAWERVQYWLGLHAELLEAWPTLWSAAGALRHDRTGGAMSHELGVRA